MLKFAVTANTTTLRTAKRLQKIPLARYPGPLALEKSVVLAALDFLHQIAKRFVIKHAAACCLHFGIESATLFERPLISGTIANSQSEERVKFSGRRCICEQSFELRDRIGRFQNLTQGAFAG